MNKYDRFAMANERSGLVAELDKSIGKWGRFSIDHVEVILLISAMEKISPVLLAVTWQNESAFKFYPEHNRNEPRNPNDDFEEYDTGPMQLSVKRTRADVDPELRFVNAKGIDLDRAFGTKSPLFNGDPLENLRLASRKLLRIGQGVITGPSETILYTKAVGDDWAALDEAKRNERRAVAYTGPEARPSRYRSWVKYAPMFETFFSLYQE